MMQRMMILLLEGLAHSTKPARSNMTGNPMKLETGGSASDLGRTG